MLLQGSARSRCTINSRGKFVTLAFPRLFTWLASVLLTTGGLNRSGACSTRWSLRGKVTLRSSPSETVTPDGGLGDPQAFSALNFCDSVKT